MLEIIVPVSETYDEKKEEFVTLSKPQVLQMEHSLISISKWEEKWAIPYFSDAHKKTSEQVFDYLRCMTINKNVDPNVYDLLSRENIIDINNYIDAKHTATWFSSDEKKEFIKKVLPTLLLPLTIKSCASFSFNAFSKISISFFLPIISVLFITLL